MAVEHLGDFLHRGQPAACDLRKPVPDKLPCRTFVVIPPKASEDFFQPPSPAIAKGHVLKLEEKGLQPQVEKVAQPKVFAALDQPSPGLPIPPCGLGKKACSRTCFTNLATAGSFDPRVPATFSTSMLFSEMNSSSFSAGA